MSQSTDCWIYRSPKKDEMYLYIVAEDDFSKVPEELLRRFGTPQRVMQLTLSPSRKLARVEIEKVILSLRQHGYFLQMPPKLEPELYRGNLD